MAMNSSPDRLSEIRLIVAHAVGLSPADMADDAELLTTFAADWHDLGVAISRIEEKYQVNIPMGELGDAPTIRSIYRVVAHHANWPA
jgi:acyl carrier protein